jgi:hypothetical protein
MTDSNSLYKRGTYICFDPNVNLGNILEKKIVKNVRFIMSPKYLAKYGGIRRSL